MDIFFRLCLLLVLFCFPVHVVLYAFFVVVYAQGGKREEQRKAGGRRGKGREIGRKQKKEMRGG